MKVVALCLSMPKSTEYKDKRIETGFFKTRVDGPRIARKHNIDGDGQADLKLHGGPNKAVYAFPSEHYAFYQEQLAQDGYEWGQFGENLTTKGTLESGVRIGNRYRVGKALLEVSQPRSPCFKFAMRFDSNAAVKLCVKSARTGFYFRVLEEGAIQSGDTVQLIFENRDAPSVEETHTLYYLERFNEPQLKRALHCEQLTQLWRDEFERRLKVLGDMST